MILTSVQIKAADSLYMKENGMTERGLVEKAMTSAYAVFEKHVGNPRGKKILVLCGRGLNGADGYALSLLLMQNGAHVHVFPVYAADGETAEELLNNCKSCGAVLAEDITDNYDIIIDAVFGIGFHGGLDEPAVSVFKKVSQIRAYKIALDVPSGVCADSAAVSAGAFRADMTIALCAKKPCHLLYPAKAHCGEITVADIGFGMDIIDRVNPYLYELKSHDYKALVEKRDDLLHKGAFGRAGLVVGSTGYRGAAVLAVKAALRCGAGIVSAFVPDTIYNAFSSQCLSAVINPLKSKNGCIDDKTLLQKLEGCTAVLCGSGLGLTDGSAAAVRSVAETDLPVVFDGDALTVISRDLSLLKRAAHTVITPHMGEFARLCNKSIEEIRAHRITVAMQFATDNRCVLLLKDSVSVIALPDGRAFILSNPTSALSKGGSGDVLAGMLCSFMAQGYLPAAAAVIAASLHNACGHAACENLGSFSALPEDFINMLPLLLK